MSDIACCLLGFYLARKLPPWASITLFLAIELAMLLSVRDSLLLNILMLIHPFPALRHWQTAG